MDRPAHSRSLHWPQEITRISNAMLQRHLLHHHSPSKLWETAGRPSSVKLRLKTSNPCLKYICPNFYHHMYFVSCRKSCIPQNNDAYYLAGQPDQSACSRQADDPPFYTMCLFTVYLTIILEAKTTGHKINGLQNKFWRIGKEQLRTDLGNVLDCAYRDWGKTWTIINRYVPWQHLIVVLPRHKSEVLPLNQCVLLTLLHIYNVTLLLTNVPSRRHLDQM
jgi:hypothetical protein